MTASATAPSNTKASVRSGPIRWLVLGGLLMIASITIGTTIMVGNFRERALTNSERELENTSLLLARHFDQQLTDFRAIQEDLVAYVQSAGMDTSERYKRRMSSPDIHLMLKTKITALSYVGAVNLFDSDGTLINSSNVWPVPAISLADRAWFKTFKFDSNAPSLALKVKLAISTCTGRNKISTRLTLALRFRIASIRAILAMPMA